MIALLLTSTEAAAQAVLSKEKRLAWDVVGLDSNDVDSGPDTFPVGQRVCNTGDMDATNVTAELQWQDTNAYIDLATGTPATTAFGTLAPGDCVDAYFNITVERDSDAFDTARRYLIEFDSDQTLPISAPIDAATYNEIYVERLISQARNAIDSIVGPTTVYEGETYDYTLTAATATNGYEQLQSFIGFPNNIFRVVSVSATYSADLATNVDDTVYTDACGWVHDPQDNSSAGDGVWYFTNGTNRACATGDKEGGDISLDYSIEIIGTGTAEVEALIHDFSGSSFHYNSDFGLDVLAIEARELPTLSIADASVVEGNAGPNNLVFTVTLSEARTDTDVMFNYGTTGISATAGVDFTTTNGTGTITAGTTSTTITVPIITELVYEGDETFQVTLSGPVAAAIDDGTAQGTIENDDAVPTITIGDTSITEGGNLVFTLSLSNPSGEAIGGSVTPTALVAGLSDFDGTVQNFAFPVGMTSTQVSVPTTDDGTFEGSETMRLVLTSITQGTATGVNNFGTGTILDNDTPPPPPDVTIGDASISEGGALVLPVALSATATETISFTVVIVGGGSATGADYSLLTGTVTINAGASAGTITLSTVDDAIFEGSETVIVGVGSVTQGTLGNTSDTGTGTITDNDGVPNLSGLDAATVEGGNLSFAISLSNPSAAAITISYSTTPGTASNTDFTPASSSVTFAPGETSKTITIASVPDDIDEMTEVFTLGLSSADSVNITTPTLNGTITDDDGAPSVTIGDASVTEGGNLVFTVTLSNPSAATIELALGTLDGTAVAADYDNSGATVTFGPGIVSQTVSIASTPDTIDELDETFTLAVSSVVQGTVGDTSDTGTGTILDDDGAPTLQIGDISVIEGGNLIFPITLSNASATDTVVTFRPANGTASASDYNTADVQVTIAAGSTTSMVAIPTVGDTIAESDETVILSVLSVDSGTLSDVSDTGTGTITDDDGDPTVQIDDVVAIEGNALLFTVSLSNPSALDITLQMGTVNGTASGTDYATAPFQVTIPAGETSTAATIATVDDDLDESDETMTLFVSSVVAGAVGDFSDTGLGTIQDDDGPPSVLIADAEITEGGILAFAVSLSNPSPADITLELTPTDLTASAGDYTATPVLVTFTAGSTTATANVPTLQDSIDEMDETILLAVTAVIAGALGDTSDTGVGTILDDDGLPDITIDDASIAEGGVLAFPVTLSNPSTEDLVITFAPSDGTATSSDYTAAPVQVTIPAGATTATVNVPTTSDSDDEPDETVNLAILSVDSGAAGDISDTAIGTILDDDGAPSLSIGDAVTLEGGDLLFTLTLSNPSAVDITLTLLPMGVSADGADYVGTAIQVTIPAGQLSATAVVPTLADAIEEGDETLQLSVASVDAGDLSDVSDTGTGTIQDAAALPDPAMVPVMNLWWLVLSCLGLLAVASRRSRGATR